MELKCEYCDENEDEQDDEDYAYRNLITYCYKCDLFICYPCFKRGQGHMYRCGECTYIRCVGSINTSYTSTSTNINTNIICTECGCNSNKKFISLTYHDYNERYDFMIMELFFKIKTKNKKLEDENIKLKNEILHLKYKPNSIGYNASKKEFDSLIS